LALASRAAGKAPMRVKPASAGIDEQLKALSLEYECDLSTLPEDARADWSEDELRLWFVSGGQFAPVRSAKLRGQSHNRRMNGSISVRQRAALSRAQEAAARSPWWSKMTTGDQQKSHAYREVALMRGVPTGRRTLFSRDDPQLTRMLASDTLFAFEKHILLSTSPDDHRVVHCDEGFVHSESAVVGRGLDLRYFWDSESLRLTGVVAFSLAAVGGWSAGRGNGGEAWGSTMVHGGCIEAVLDELTAEVMKVNVAPEMATSEIVVSLQHGPLPYVTYLIEAEVVDFRPPIVTTTAVIKSVDGQVIATATARNAMLDRVAKARAALPPKAPAVHPNGVTDKNGTRTASGAEAAAPVAPPPSFQLPLTEQQIREGSAALAASEDSGAADKYSVDETLAQYEAIRAKLVTQLQEKYSCKDLSPPPEAIGWSGGQLKEFFLKGFFENGS